VAAELRIMSLRLGADGECVKVERAKEMKQGSEIRSQRSEDPTLRLSATLASPLTGGPPTARR